MSLRGEALRFATAKHEGQVRKYTGEPYIEHPKAVADIVRSVPHTAEMIAAAYLHDVVEDCGVRHLEIRYRFGSKIGALVYWLTDISRDLPANRAERKRIDREFIAFASDEAKTIKLADVINNSESILRCDPSFSKVWLEEKKLLLPKLEGGNQLLLARAYQQIDDYSRSLA